MDDDSQSRDQIIDRLSIFLAVLVLLALLILLGFSLLQGDYNTRDTGGLPPEVVTGTSVPIAEAGGVNQIDARPTIGLATPWDVPGGQGFVPATPVLPVVTPRPIQIQGPPPDSRFRLSDETPFFWIYPEELKAGEQFVVYLTVDGRQMLVGTLAEMNLGTGYQLRVSPGDIVGMPGKIGWQVVLKDTVSEMIIAASEIRSVILLDG